MNGKILQYLIKKEINMFIHQNTRFFHFHKIKHMNPPSTPIKRR